MAGCPRSSQQAVPCPCSMCSIINCNDSMDAYIDSFLDYLARERQVSLHTRNAYAVDLTQFCEYLK
ncbi:MAG: hypothetical protein CFK49_09435, partial [Armatimonadetes bacterium JP3_11]